MASPQSPKLLFRIPFDFYDPPSLISTQLNALHSPFNRILVYRADDVGLFTSAEFFSIAIGWFTINHANFMLI